MKITNKTAFEIALEEESGESIESLSSMPIDERRKNIESKLKRPIRILSEFPFIGRGNITTIVSRKEIDAGLNWVLKLR